MTTYSTSLIVPVTRCAAMARTLRILIGIMDAPAAVAARRRNSRWVVFNLDELLSGLGAKASLEPRMIALQCKEAKGGAHHRCRPPGAGKINSTTGLVVMLRCAQNRDVKIRRD